VVHDISAIKAQLLGKKYRAEDIPAIDAAGIYVFNLETPSELAGVNIDASGGPIYLGMTDSSLKQRLHFTHEHSGFSTLRRTLGALLKTSLNLRAIPRGSGPSQTNVQNYRFPDEDERRLTDWMNCHLTYGFAVIANDITAVEQALTRELRPPLNLTGWPNPQRQYVRTLRDACRLEAAQARRSLTE
jgi:hypothetical protein